MDSTARRPIYCMAEDSGFKGHGPHLLQILVPVVLGHGGYGPSGSHAASTAAKYWIASAKLLECTQSCIVGDDVSCQVVLFRPRVHNRIMNTTAEHSTPEAPEAELAKLGRGTFAC